MIQGSPLLYHSLMAEKQRHAKQVHGNKHQHAQIKLIQLIFCMKYYISKAFLLYLVVISLFYIGRCRKLLLHNVTVLAITVQEH